jgi:hypothetical protein
MMKQTFFEEGFEWKNASNKNKWDTKKNQTKNE